MVLGQTRAHLSNPEMPTLIDAFISQFHAAKKYRFYFNIPVSSVFRVLTSVNILSLLSPHLDPSHSSQLEETDAFQPHSKWFTTTTSLGVSGRLHGALAVANPPPVSCPSPYRGGALRSSLGPRSSGRLSSVQPVHPLASGPLTSVHRNYTRTAASSLLA